VGLNGVVSGVCGIVPCPVTRRANEEVRVNNNNNNNNNYYSTRWCVSECSP